MTKHSNITSYDTTLEYYIITSPAHSSASFSIRPLSHTCTHSAFCFVTRNIPQIFSLPPFLTQFSTPAPAPSQNLSPPPYLWGHPAFGGGAIARCASIAFAICEPEVSQLHLEVVLVIVVRFRMGIVVGIGVGVGVGVGIGIGVGNGRVLVSVSVVYWHCYWHEN